VQYATGDGTATTSDGDYQAASGTLTFAPGQMNQTVTVLVNGHSAYENNETFTLNLSGPVNATIQTATGIGTILNDDPAPTLAINNVTGGDGASGTTSFVFTVTLTGATELTTTVNYSTADGTATTADGDYQATSGTLTFAPGQTSQTVTIFVNSDTAYENAETFNVNLSGTTNATISTATGTGTILNDDPAPTLAINNVTMTVGASGTTNFVFTISMTGNTELTTTVKYVTANGTATVTENDYVPTSGTLTFNPGITSQTITVVANGNASYESSETFLVNLSAATNATISTGTGTGTIVSGVLAPPHIDWLSAVQLPLSKLLLRPVNVTDPDDAVVSVSYYFETDGMAGLQTGPGGDQLIYVSTNPNNQWAATVFYRQGYYYAQAMDTSGLLSNVVQVFVGFKPIPLPGPVLTPSSPPAGDNGAPTGSSVTTVPGSSAGWSSVRPSTNQWWPSALPTSNEGFLRSHVLAEGASPLNSGLWDIVNPLDHPLLN
jgi:hypothetical protein